MTSGPIRSDSSTGDLARKARVAAEEQAWSDLFLREIQAETNGRPLFSSAWWQRYYEQLADTMQPVIGSYDDANVLEVGCGSGKASFVAAPAARLTCLDIAAPALDFAKLLSKRLNANGVRFVRADVYELPFIDRSFDVVWNIGMFEHYSVPQITAMLSECMRVLRTPGTLAFGVPNFFSGPILLAYVRKYLWRLGFQGYKLQTEHFYSADVLRNCAQIAAINSGRSTFHIRIADIGNPLPMGTPSFVLRCGGTFLEEVLPANRFLRLFLVEVSE